MKLELGHFCMAHSPKRIRNTLSVVARCRIIYYNSNLFCVFRRTSSTPRVSADSCSERYTRTSFRRLKTTLGAKNGLLQYGWRSLQIKPSQQQQLYARVPCESIAVLLYVFFFTLVAFNHKSCRIIPVTTSSSSAAVRTSTAVLSGMAYLSTYDIRNPFNF